MSFLRVQSKVLRTAGGKLGKSAMRRSACSRGPPESCSNSFCSCTALLRATSRSLMAISAFLWRWPPPSSRHRKPSWPDPCSPPKSATWPLQHPAPLSGGRSPHPSHLTLPALHVLAQSQRGRRRSQDWIRQVRSCNLRHLHGVLRPPYWRADQTRP